MNTRVIVHCLTTSSLLVWIVACDFSVTDAGGPPIRLAVDRQVTRSVEESEEEFAGSTRLLPTQWDDSAQLIPTEIEPGRAQWVRSEVSSSGSSDTHLFNGSQLPWADETYVKSSIKFTNDFVDRHFFDNRLHPTDVSCSDATDPVIAPWIVGERPIDWMLGISTQSVSFFPNKPNRFSRGESSAADEMDSTWLPASQWWSWVLGARKIDLLVVAFVKDS